MPEVGINFRQCTIMVGVRGWGWLPGEGLHVCGLRNWPGEACRPGGGGGSRAGCSKAARAAGGGLWWTSVWQELVRGRGGSGGRPSGGDTAGDGRRPAVGKGVWGC